MSKAKFLLKEYGAAFPGILLVNVIEAISLSLVLLFLLIAQKNLINFLLLKEDIKPFLFYLLISLIFSVFCIFSRQKRIKNIEKTLNFKREKIYGTLISSEYTYFSNKKEIISKFNRNFDYYQKFIVEDIPRVISVYCNVIIMSIGIFSIDPIFLYISLITAFVFAITLPIMKKLEDIEKEIAKSSENSWLLFENIKTNKNLFVFYEGSIKYLIKLNNVFKDIEKVNLKKGIVLSAIYTIGLITNLLREFGIIIAAITLFGSTYGFGDIFSLFMLTSFLNTAIVEIVNTYSSLQVSYTAMKEIAIFDSYHQEKLESTRENKKVESLFLEEVSYSYDEKVIKYPTIQLTKGNIYKINGAVGTGKTTLLQIICGLRKADSGSIMIEKSTQNINQLRSLTSVVEQNNKVFNGNIIENITMFSDDYNLKEIYEVIELTGLDTRINLSEVGMQEIISNKTGLSGGQKQRVNLCRALYKNSPILILDEPFSALDKKNILKIKNYLNHIKKEKIIILVDHKNIFLDAEIISILLEEVK